MIVVLGRPGLSADGRLDRTAGRIALAAAEAGASVELVGSVGDDPDGDAVALELGRAGIGHAALLRDPAGTTPRTGDEAVDASPQPRLDAADVELGLGYLAEYRVVVLAEPLDEGAIAAAATAGRYQGAALVVVVGSEADPVALPAEATVLEMPDEDAGAFAALVGRYAALLDAGRGAQDAWQEALDRTGWEAAAE